MHRNEPWGAIEEPMETHSRQRGQTTGDHKLDLPLLIERFPSITFHSSVRNLGVALDSPLTFSEHVANLTRSSYFHLRRLRAIRRSVSSHVFTSIVHAF